MFHWPPAFARALDQTVLCPGCKMTYYDDPSEDLLRCPFCDTGRPAVVKASVRDVSGKALTPSNESSWLWVREFSPQSSSPLSVPNRLFFPFSITEGDSDFLEIDPGDTEILIRRCDELDIPRLSVKVRGSDRAGFSGFRTSVKLPLTAGRKGFSVLVDGKFPRIVEFKFEEEVS